MQPLLCVCVVVVVYWEGLALHPDPHLRHTCVHIGMLHLSVCLSRLLLLLLLFSEGCYELSLVIVDVVVVGFWLLLFLSVGAHIGYFILFFILLPIGQVCFLPAVVAVVVIVVVNGCCDACCYLSGNILPPDLDLSMCTYAGCFFFDREYYWVFHLFIYVVRCSRSMVMGLLPYWCY